jgi:hypothetical protein
LDKTIPDAAVPKAHAEPVPAEEMPITTASAVGRRQFFEFVGGAAAASVAANLVPLSFVATPASAAVQAPPTITLTRRETAYQIRHRAALHHYELRRSPTLQMATRSAIPTG